VAYILGEQRRTDPLGCFARYREYLERHRARFPAAAYALATSDWYFDPGDHRCPHDAWLEAVQLVEPSSGERGEARSVSLTVRLLGAYHDGHIELSYPRVCSYRLDASELGGGHRDWLYDELRVDDAGRVEHEIEWAGADHTARWTIVASDVQLRWMPRLLT
jgi:hypothetical protein